MRGRRGDSVIATLRVYAIPAKYKGTYRRALTGKSRKDSIRAHCLMCCAWQEIEVEKCTAALCPLFPHRLGRPVARSDPSQA